MIEQEQQKALAIIPHSPVSRNISKKNKKKKNKAPVILEEIIEILNYDPRTLDYESLTRYEELCKWKAQ